MASNRNDAKPDDDITIRNVNSEDVTQVARNFTSDSSVKVLDYCIRPYSSEVLGFSASHLQLNITLQRKNTNNPENVKMFVKAVAYEKQDQLELTDSTGIFIKEWYIFKHLMPKLVENSNTEKWSATCYLAKSDVLIMEDLRTLGYGIIPDLIDNFNAFKSVLSTVAKLHSSSIVTEAKLNEHSRVPKSLDQYYPDAFKEVVLCHTGKIHEMMEPGIHAAVAVGEHLGYNGDSIRRALLHMYEIVKPSKKYQNVVCHGDLWANNMMFDNSEPLRKCILVDFQIVRYAPPVLDLLHLLHYNTSRSFREKYEKDLVEWYHSELEKSVKSHNLKNNVKFPSLKEIIDALDDLRLFGVGITTLYFPFFLPQIPFAKELQENPEAMKKFTYENRADAVLKCMSLDENYNEKIGGIITELANISDRYLITHL